MSPSDQNDILRWNEAQRSLIMDFALKNAEGYFNDDSICSYARFDHEFFWPLVAEFNMTFGTRATSSTLAACFRNLKDGYLYYDEKLIEFPGMGWFYIDKAMAMVINSQTYRSRLENDVKKYPGLKGWVWGNDAYLACPYIDEIESLENMVGYYCKEWISGESDEAYPSENNFDDSDDSICSDDSMFSSTRQKLRSLARSNHASKTISVTTNKPQYKTSTLRPAATRSPNNETNFLSKKPQTGSIQIAHNSAMSNNARKEDLTPDFEMLAFPAVNREENINYTDIQLIDIDENSVKLSNSYFRKRPLSDILPNESPYKRQNCTQGTSKDDTIDLR